jgi:hypothetical protein
LGLAGQSCSFRKGYQSPHVILFVVFDRQDVRVAI